MSGADQMGFDFGGAPSPGSARVAQELRCAQCRTYIAVPAWYAAIVELHFCGDACRQHWVNEQPDLQPKMGQHSRRRGANWAEQARKARTRDGFACRVCSVSEEELGRQLDVHHKIPYRSFQSNVEANRLENLIAVCPSCHAKLEAELRRTLPLFGNK
jgi:5-methylcytosine-specific restriction endonuclease McrA